MKRKLGRILLGCTLLMGVLAGAPMKPEEIEELLLANSKAQAACVLETDDSQDGDDALKETGLIQISTEAQRSTAQTRTS